MQCTHIETLIYQYRYQSVWVTGDYQYLYHLMSWIGVAQSVVISRVGVQPMLVHIHLPVADPDFPEEERQPQRRAPTYYLTIFSWKLHKNKEILTQSGRPSCPLISATTYMRGKQQQRWIYKETRNRKNHTIRCMICPGGGLYPSPG